LILLLGDAHRALEFADLAVTMHVKRLELDGFKSYSQRTVIDKFDREFNAITGLNGSGKSNILDGICFALGIQNTTLVSPPGALHRVGARGQSPRARLQVGAGGHPEGHREHLLRQPRQVAEQLSAGLP